FTSVTRTVDELSVVCAYDHVPEGVPMEGPWRAFKVQGPIVMTLIGVVASLANPLEAAGISIFAVSTFDTHYVLVHEPDFDDELAPFYLEACGFTPSPVGLIQLQDRS